MNFEFTFGTVVGLLILLLFAGTFVWLVWRSISRSDDPAKMIFRYGLTCVVLGLAGYAIANTIRLGYAGAFIVGITCMALGIVLSFTWTPSLAAWFAKPITSLFDGGDEEPEPEPVYSIAHAKRKAGHYLEAVRLVRQQLDRFPNDLTGQLLLAEIQAENLFDVAAAEVTIDRFCAQPGHAPRNIAFALTSLADWHLKLAQDVERARRALEKIPQLLPGTPEALAAEQRLAHLGSTTQLLEGHERPKLELKAGVANLGLTMESRTPASGSNPGANPGAAIAAEYVKHLQQFPLDGEVREKLALVYAEHYRRLDLAADELNQLIEMPNQPQKQVTRWLNLLADLQVKLAGDVEAARLALERIVTRYPDQAVAEQARQRLAYLKLELRGGEKTSTIKLGAYEQNLGLKKADPPPTRPVPPINFAAPRARPAAAPRVD